MLSVGEEKIALDAILGQEEKIDNSTQSVGSLFESLEQTEDDNDLF